MLTDREAAALAEEEALLRRVQHALTQARGERKAGVSISTDELKSLRDEAAQASEVDSGALLHELAVRQQLAARPTTVLPDPRSPYLAHLRLEESGELRDYLLGHGTYIDTRQNLRVVDWRVAPVAQLFYRYREGDHFEEQFPGRLASGTVRLRRVVVVHQGQLVQLIGDDFALRRDEKGAWVSGRALAMASGGAGTSAQTGHLGLGVGKQEHGTRADVTALLDAEQYAAIAAPPDEPLLVLGSAGSGKTTVALHRLARLTAAQPDEIPLPRARVVVPEEGLARLAHRLLSPLLPVEEEQKPPEVVHTLDDFLLRLARRAFGVLPRICMEPPALVTSLKRHPAFFEALEAAIRAEERRVKAELMPLWRQLSTYSSDRAFLKQVVDASRGTLPSTCIEDTVQHTMWQLAEPTSRQLRGVDVERRTALDNRELDSGTPDELAGSVDVEDLPILLSMLAWRRQLNLPQASHLVLDEAEDFSLFDLEALRGTTKEFKGVTLAGDEAQQTHPSFAGWQRSVEALGVKGASTIRLTTSYRCPRPIAELARHVLGPLAPTTPVKASREGVPVGRFHFPGEAPAHLFLAGALKDLLEQEPHASVAVIAATVETARRFYPLVAELPRARFVQRGEFPFTPGLDVTDVDSVKGLEWDYVIVPDANAGAWAATDDGRRRLHVAVTRASHQLWLVSPGTPTSILPADAGA